MLKATLLASALAALLLVPAAASAGDRGGHRGHFVRPPKVVFVLPHHRFVFDGHPRTWYPKPKVWHKFAPRHRHVWRAVPPPRAHWRGDRDDHRRWDRDDHRRWDGDDHRRWKRDDHRRGPGHGHGPPGRHWKDGKRHFAGLPWNGRRRD
jgi:hypothetical protein